MPVCRQCGTAWPDGYAVCPSDGTQLSVPPVTALASTSALAVAAAPLDDDSLPPGSRAGEYVIEVKLGEGGMGAVYGARHPVIGKRAAVKVIKRELSASLEAVDRFVREAQAVNTIGHPNIVDVFGFGTLADGRSFFVMEWLEGESLRERMLRPLAFADALEILSSIATALAAAHDAGVVHRDLKPDNVFLARSKGQTGARVKLLDFGLAKLSGTGGGDGGIHRTRTGVVMGTPLYLSPEQAKGEKVDAASDIYSLGVMAYEMAAGVVPFSAGSAIEIMAMHISARPQRLAERAPRIPTAFDELVTRMLDKDGRMRPSIAAVAQQLEAIRAQPELASAAAPVDAPVVQRKRSGRVIALVAGGAVAVAAAGLLVLGTSRRRHAPVVKAEPPAVPAVATNAPLPPATPAPPAPPATTVVSATPAPPKPEPPRTVARLGKVSITIAGAVRGRILVDGKVLARDTAAITLELAAGDHTLRVDAPGRKPVTQKLHVDPGATRTLSVELEQRSFNTVHDPFAE